MNDLQDGQIAAKHGDVPIVVHPFMGRATANWGIGDESYMASTGAGSLFVSPQLNTGCRIKSITFPLIGNASADVTVKTYVTGGGSSTLLDTTVYNNPAAVFADQTINIPDTTLAAGKCLVVEFAANAAGIGIGAVVFNRDKP